MQTRRLQALPECHRRQTACVVHARPVFDPIAVLQHERVQDVRRRFLIALTYSKSRQNRAPV